MRGLLCVLILTAVLIGCDQPPAEPSADLLVFTADWCQACRRDKPLLSAIIADEFRVVEIDADRNKGTLVQYDVTTLPTYIVCGPSGGEYARTGDLRYALKLLRWLRHLR